MVAPYSGQMRYAWDSAAGAYRDLYTGNLVGGSIPQDAGNQTTFDGDEYAPVGTYAPGSTQAPERPGYTDTLDRTTVQNPYGEQVSGATQGDLGYVTHWNPDSGPSGQGAYELNPANPATGRPYSGVGALQDAGIDLIRPINPDGSFADPSAQPLPTRGISDDRASGGGSSGSGYSDSGYGSSRRSSGGGYSSGSSRSGGSSYNDDPMSNLPAYADGSRHPAQTGEPLTPGGDFNDGSSNYRPRRIVGHDYAVGQSYRNMPAANWSSKYGWETKPGEEAARERYYGYKNMVMGMMPAMGGGMMGGTVPAASGNVGGGGGRSGGGGTNETGMRNARGWAGRQNFTPASLTDIYYNPQYLYPHILPGLNTGDAFFGQLHDQLSPNLQALWSGSAGARKKAGTGPDHYANWINNAVKSYSTPGGQFFDSNQLIKGLTAPQRGSTQWKAQQGTPFGEQAYNLTNQIGAVAATTMNPMAASATMSYLDTLINAAGSRNLTRGPKRQLNVNTQVGRKLFV